MEQVSSLCLHGPFALDSLACRFHGVAPSLGPVMPKPAKEKSLEELTEGQPSNLSLSQEMKELYQPPRALVWVRSNGVLFLTLLPQAGVERGRCFEDCRAAVLNCLGATGPIHRAMVSERSVQILCMQFQGLKVGNFCSGIRFHDKLYVDIHLNGRPIF